MRLFSRASVRLVLAASVLLVTAACDDDDDPTSPVLPVPQNLAGSAASTTSIGLTWSPVTNASYVLQRATGAAGGTFASIASPTTTSYTDAGLEIGATYRYRIAAVVGTDTSAFSSPVTVSTTAVVTLQGNITTNQTLTANTIYRLNGLVQVTNGATLTIEPGTRITGQPVTSGAQPVVSALIIRRGAKLVADGTAQAPIVMTSANEPGDRFPGDWGGLVIVGNARSNVSATVTVEGPFAAQDTIQWQGGTADNDSSGVLRYVRVEFAGAAAVINSELNSLSMYAVGNRTRVEYVQALAGLDDAFEWFGGTVDGRYLVAYETGDDLFDWAEGYRGRNQFLIGLHTARLAARPGAAGVFSSEPNGFEGDGCGISTSGVCAQGFNSTPYSQPVFANFTVVGPGGGVLPSRIDGGVGAVIRRGTGANMVNGIIARWPERCVSIFQSETNARITADSLDIRNVLCVQNGANYAATIPGDTIAFDPDTATSRFGQFSKFAGRGNVVAQAGVAATAQFQGLPAAGTVPTTASLNWVPAAGSLLATTTGNGNWTGLLLNNRVAGFFGGSVQATTYVGAVAPGTTMPWYAGWTSYARN